MAAAHRILIAELDSVSQRERYLEKGHEAATADFTQMLRVGRLVADTVLVTDAMLLDGTYFMRLGPEGVMRALGASDVRFPLTITGPALTLEEGLAHRRSRPGFRWSLLDIADPAHVPDRVERVWHEWLSFADRGLMVYLPQRQSFVVPLLAAPPPVDEDLAASIEVLRTTTLRSEAWQAIDSMAVGVSDAAALRAWWNAGYLRAIAENARADWLSFDGARGSAPTSGTPLQLPERLLTWARDATSASIALAWDATRRQRAALRKKQTWSAMRSLAYSATQVAELPSRRRVLIASVLAVLLATALVLVALPGLQTSALDNPFTWVVFALVALSTIPYSSIRALVGLLKPDARATLILQSETEVR